ncbi:MAG TPA: helix-turn-helix domain-containing protein [Acidimicrobiia bacterium]|jgi:excisionase family DNA binding protein|nr:helix-turn-helix domain-containing protein [Acidimicrobiia bacterium]
MVKAQSDPAPFLTVVEAAALLRVGRTVAYQQARQYLATGGREGLPVVRLGRQLRVPRHALEEMMQLVPSREMEVSRPTRRTSR